MSGAPMGSTVAWIERSTVAWIERSHTGYVFEGLFPNLVVFFGTFVGPLEDGTELGEVHHFTMVL